MMTITLAGQGECDVVHHGSGARLRTAKGRQFGGTGSSFSSTDLLAVALGTCIATDLEPVAQRHGVTLSAIRISVEKQLDTSPKRLTRLSVIVQLPAAVDDVLRLKLQRAADHCLVQRSLSPDIAIAVSLQRTSP